MNTRYPIILVHGLAMKDTFFLRSWGRIDRILRSQGYTVYKSNVDGFGTVEGNAAQLKAEIDGILQETGAEKVNLIAHSKGGLDAKYMIQQLDMAHKVASLTTLCTPHRGTPIASFIMGLELFGGQGMWMFGLVVAVSYMLSGYYGLYKSQLIIYSKYRSVYVHRKAHR